MRALDTTFIEYRDCLWKSYLNTPDFFTKYPSYYFWLKDVAEAHGLKKMHLGQIWGMIPDEFRDKWSLIDLSFKDADYLYKAFEEVRKKLGWKTEAKAQFFKDYPSYYFWLKAVAPEAQDLKKMHLGGVWTMIPSEFKECWSKIFLPFKDADKLHNAFEEVRKSWYGNIDAKAQFFATYSSYYFWLKFAPEANDLKEINLANVWGMIPDDFRDKWSYIYSPFKDADKLHNAFEEVQKSWDGNEEAKAQFFITYPSYYFWLKDVAEAQALKKMNLRSVWGMIPDDFRDKWSYIHLPFKDADNLYKAFDKFKKEME